MADSDDEYDRKRRDKFRGERPESYSREGRRDDRRREEWVEREWSSRSRARPDYREYRGGGGGGGSNRERYSPVRSQDLGPPMKRMRADWDDRSSRSYPHPEYYNSWPSEHYLPHHSNHHYGGHPNANSNSSNNSREVAGNFSNSNIETQPPMMSFKTFLGAQEDTITDEEAIKRYNEYKLEFRRQQLNEFFVAHKDEEWFKIKYHPEESIKRKKEQISALKKRVEVFLELLNSGDIDKVSIDVDQANPLLHLLDTVVIKLEGGTEEDLKVLDAAPPLISQEPVQTKEKEKTKDAEKEKEKDKDNKEKEISDDKKEEIKVLEEGVVIENNKENEEKTNDKLAEKEKKKNKKKKKKENVDENHEDSTTKVANKERMEEDEDGIDENKTKTSDTNAEEASEESEERKEETTVEGQRELSEGENASETLAVNSKKRKRSRSSSSSSSDSDDVAHNNNNNNSSSSSTSSSSSSTNSETFDAGKMETLEAEKPIAEGENEKMEEEEEETKEEVKEKDEEETKEKSEEQEENKVKKSIEPEAVIDLASEEKDKEPPPRALHKTSSIFLRNLAPTITKAEVEAMCKRFPGFLRVAIADPQPERRWFRRGWVSFERQVNIKEICWNLNNIRLRDCELGAIVNRDLLRRIRTVNGITAHKQVVRADIKLSAKIIHNLDAKVGLWNTVKKDGNESNSTSAPKESEEQNANDDDTIKQLDFTGLSSKNPILTNITDYLIEEASAEEEELLGMGSSGDQQEEEGQLMGEGEGPIEKDLTLIKVLDRLILYLRIVHSVDYYNHCEYPNEDEMPNRCGIMHVRGPTPVLKVSFNEIHEYCRNFEGKMISFLAPNAAAMPNAEFEKLGAKNSEAEVEKFVQANTQEISTEKWLCPLSGKKFKGPDFIRKHIFNKHAEKVAEVKAEAEYFNNYLKDPKRPMLPEHPGNKAPPARENPRENYPPHGNMSGFGGFGGGNFGNSRSVFGGGGYGSGFGGGFGMPRPTRGGFNRGRGNNVDFRPVIRYRDLDAPREPDEFL